MTSKKETKGLTRRDMLGQTSVIAAAGVTGIAGGIGASELVSRTATSMLRREILTNTTCSSPADSAESSASSAFLRCVN